MNTQAPSASAGRSRRTVAISILTLVFGAALIAWLLLWYFVLSRRESTDDAYVNGNMVTISAQTAGTVIAVLADDTQLVQTGQVLLRLDPTDAQVALDQAAAALSQAVRQVRQQSATANQYEAAVDSRNLELKLAQADLARREPLAADQAISPEELKHAQANVDLARAALSAAFGQAAAAHVPVEDVDVAANPAVQQARAAYQQAWVVAHRATIEAPVTGYVAQRTVQIGQRIQAGAVLMTVIPLDKLWIDANFKEAQLRHLRIGQPAEIVTDLYGGEARFHGHVVGMAPGTGAAFALLPAQNASGNWIKIVQRVPVRIELDPQELARHPLRIGLSASIKVATTERSGPMLAPTAANGAVAATDIYAGALADAAAQADAIIRADRTRHSRAQP